MGVDSLRQSTFVAFPERLAWRLPRSIHLMRAPAELNQVADQAADDHRDHEPNPEA